MPKRFLSAALALCAALAGAPGLTHAQSNHAPTTQGATNPRPQGPTKAPTPGAGSTPTPAPAKPAAEPGGDAKPAALTVSPLDEAGLAKLLRRGDAPAAERRPLLVNFWATWCDPCREEMPDLVKIDEEFRARGLDFVLVSLDDVEEISRGVPEFLTRMRAARIPSYLLDANDPEAAIASVDAAWRGELPATFLFDREGRLAYKHTGRIKPAALREAIRQTLAATPQATSGR